MRDNVIFKGSKSGLQLLFDQSADFDTIFGKLKAKLEAASDFFSNVNAVLYVPLAKKIFTSEQQAELESLCADYGLIWRDEPPVHEADEQQLPSQAEDNQTLVIHKTLRNGQEVVYDGSVVIMGDVNPGAKIVAGGDIVIYGTCRGIAHAGACGDTNATITANKLLASQIRIAGLIARSPDKLEEPQCVETARIKEGVLLIEPANVEREA